MDELSEKYVGKFIGPNKVVAIRATGQSTPSGALVFEVSYEQVIDNKTYLQTRLIPERALVTDIRDTSIDHTSFLQERLNVIAPEIVNLIEEYNVEFTEIDLLIAAIKKNISLRYDRATSFAFTGDDSKYIPGWAPVNDVSLLKVESIIASIPNPKDESSGE